MRAPRVIIAGMSSSCGKTTAVCALLELLRRRGKNISACKCGPDYIDPMFHSTVVGVPSANLDPFFCGEGLLCHLLCEHSGKDMTVVEGVMGYYDGTGEDGTENSAYSVARMTKSPVILVVSAKGAAASLLAVIEGFARYKPDSRVRGVIFSRASAVTYAYLADLMKKRFGDTIVPIGYIPELPEALCIPSRHLGLVTAAEIDDLKTKLRAAADLCENTLDVERMISIAGSAEEIHSQAPDIPRLPPVSIAVARDRAFCFYYDDTLRLLEKMGAEIVPFSPLDNEPVPEGADGLLIGGGYPELYAEKLEQNTVTRESVRAAVSSGMPTIAECGGFQYLGAKLEGKNMCGALPHESFPAGKLVRFGYVTLTAKESGLFGAAGTALRAHEFHYYDSTENGGGFTAVKPNGRQWECAVYTDTLYAGYPHLFLCSNIPAAGAFCRKCLEYKEKKA